MPARRPLPRQQCLRGAVLMMHAWTHRSRNRSSSSGTRKAMVFPEPVLAAPRMSRPASACRQWPFEHLASLRDLRVEWQRAGWVSLSQSCLPGGHATCAVKWASSKIWQRALQTKAFPLDASHGADSLLLSVAQVRKSHRPRIATAIRFFATDVAPWAVARPLPCQW